MFWRFSSSPCSFVRVCFTFTLFAPIRYKFAFPVLPRSGTHLLFLSCPDWAQVAFHVLFLVWRLLLPDTLPFDAALHEILQRHIAILMLVLVHIKVGVYLDHCLALCPAGW